MEISQHSEGEMLSSISTQLVQMHSRFYGKGPNGAKSHFVDNAVLCVLEGGFTAAEKTLIEKGDTQAVLAVRYSFQTAMEDQFKAVVEDATGRKVIAYMSQIHVNPDLAVELFMLAP
jgi:uncharacterized protein YbcI